MLAANILLPSAAPMESIAALEVRVPWFPMNPFSFFLCDFLPKTSIEACKSTCKVSPFIFNFIAPGHDFLQEN